MHSFEDITNSTDYRAAMRRTGRVGSARIGVNEMTWAPGRYQNLTADYSALALYRSSAEIRHIIAGEKRPVRRFVEGDMMLRPPNLDYVTEYDQQVDIIVVALENELVQSVTTSFNTDVGAVFGRLQCRPFRSPLVEGLVTNLADCAVKGGDRLYADALSLALIHELWRIADGAVRPSEVAPGQLSPQQMRRIDQAIAEAPARQIALENLAALAGMSTPAFSAALKRTTGSTPYKYVLSQRLIQTRDLLETTGLSLIEIAFRCGFSSQSHMTDVFRTKLGTTPGKLRADRA